MPTLQKKRSVKKIVRSYSEALRKNGVSFSRVYLFGSQAKGTPQLWSDIDVAVVVKKKSDMSFKKDMKLWSVAPTVDARIEPILVAERDLYSDTPNPIAHEVYTTGIRIE